MLRVIKQNIYSLKHPLYAALTLSFASFGDAFLYPFLPQYAEVMGIPVIWIGLLLSINRFIRIAFNPVVAKLFARYGVRSVTILASLMAMISTLGYGLELGLLALLLFRMLWGMAYAILRISTLAYALEHEYIGVSLGVSKSIQEAGPMLALWVGPALLSYFSATHTFFLLALISFPSLFYAISLPDLKYIPIAVKRITFALPSLFNSITFALSFIIDGMLVIVTGSFLAKNNISLASWNLVSLAAGYLAYRRICFIFFSPISGIIAERVGFIKIFNFSFLMILVGLGFLLIGWTSVGLIIVFTFNSINNTMAPGAVAIKQADKIKAVSVNATWWDVGAAAGALTGGVLLSNHLLFEAFTIATFILGFLFVIRFWKINKR